MWSNEKDFHDGEGAEVLRSLPASETSYACTLRDLSSAEEDEHEHVVTPAHSGDSPDSPPAEGGTSPRHWPPHFRKLFPDTAFPSAENQSMCSQSALGRKLL